MLIIVIIAISFTATAFAGHDHMVIPYDKDGFGYKTRMPMTSAGDIRQHIIGQSPYKTWDMWPGKGKMYEGTEPHGSLLTTYVNDIALKSIKKLNGMANNSIVVKENYSPDKKLVAITVMYKVKGFNAETGDWYWVKYGPDYDTIAEGNVKGCIACHNSASANDYIFTGKVTK